MCSTWRRVLLTLAQRACLIKWLSLSNDFKVSKLCDEHAQRGQDCTLLQQRYTRPESDRRFEQENLLAAQQQTTYSL
jgi:hypothetical protein